MRSSMRTLLLVTTGALAVAFGTWATRNSSGTYSMPTSPGGTAVANELITSAKWNANFNDLTAEMTDSLSRSAKGGMLSQFKAVDGSGSLPGISFVQETATGLRRVGTNNPCLTVGTVDVACWDAAGFVPNPAGASPVFAGSASHAPINFKPQAAPSTPGNGDVWVDTGSNKLTYRANGATVATASSPLTRPDLPAVGQQISSSSGTFSTTSASEVDVTNLSVTITTTGRPVVLMVIPDGSINPFGISASDGTPQMFIDRGGSNIVTWQPLAQFQPFLIDPVAAGTYTWKLRLKSNGSSVGQVFYAKLAGYEL